MKPDFIVLGAMKCGTSSVCAYLEDHPEVFMLPNCDPSYFCDDDNFAKGTEWYEAHFAARNGEKICGEGSNGYSWVARFPNSAPRMFEYHPGLKLVYMVRHPVQRMVSAWIQNRFDWGDNVPPSLDRCFIEQPDWILNESLYWENISRYRRLFPDSQIFVGFLEDLHRDKIAFFSRLTEFLGVTPMPPSKREHLNPTIGKAIPSPLYSTLNHMPLAAPFKRLLPAHLKEMVRRKFLTRTIHEKPHFSEAVRRHANEAVRSDAERFLEYAGKPRDFWRFA